MAGPRIFVGSAGDEADVLMDPQWPGDPAENPEEIRLVVEELNGMVRGMGFIMRHGDLYVLGQEGDLWKMML